jgi:MoaA/NifB/PqqE/SkfB family radical SAM enzyme
MSDMSKSELLDAKRGEEIAEKYSDSYDRRREVLRKSNWKGKHADAASGKYFQDQLSLNARILKDEVGGESIENITYRIIGRWAGIRAKLIGLLRDIRSIVYLVRNRSLRETYNFFYTRVFVPAGEGSQRLFYQVPGVKWLIKKFPDLVPFPTYIELEPTTVCNKHCIHCEFTYWSPVEQVKRHVTLEEFKHMMDQMPQVRWTNITGEGSAFLNKDYVQMIRYLYEKHRSSIWLVDHLTDIPFDFLEKEVLPYIHGIYVSIDGGTKETYEKIKVGCHWDNLLENLRKIIEYKRKNDTPFPHITFRYVIMKENVAELPQFIDLINDLAAPAEWGGSSAIIEFTGLLYYPEIASHYADVIPQSIVEALRSRVGKGIHFIFAHGEEKSNPPAEDCLAWLEPYIMNPGYVMPCCSVMMSNRRPFLRKYSFGNLFESDFQAIWRSPYYEKFKKLLTDPCAPIPKVCAGCRAYRTDHRIAKYGVWDVYKDPDVPAPYTEENPDMFISLEKVKKELRKVDVAD